LIQFLSSRPSTPIPFRPKRTSLELPHKEWSPKKEREYQGSPLVNRLEASVNGNGTN